MATFLQRDSGYWQAKIRIKGFPSKSETFRTKALAEAWAKETESALHRSGFVSESNKKKATFSDLAKDFREKFAPLHYRGNSWGYKVDALESRLGDYYLTSFTPEIIAAYRDERSKDKDSRYKKNIEKAPFISQATVKSEIDILSTMLQVGTQEFGYAVPDRNRVMDIRRPKGAKFRDRRLSEDEWSCLQVQCAKSKNLLLSSALKFAVATGVRQGELLTLVWENVHLDKRYAMLRDPEQIKTEEIRAVPLSSIAISILRSLPEPHEGYVFKLKKSALYKAYKNAVKRAGVENLTWHDLRHEALSRIAEMEESFNLIEIASISGHKSLQTLKRYVHLQASKLADKLG